MRVGTHYTYGERYDKASKPEGLKRWPEIAFEEPIGNIPEFSISSAFGGMVSLYNHQAGFIAIQLENVVPTPTFTLGQSSAGICLLICFVLLFFGLILFKLLYETGLYQNQAP